MGIKMSGAEFKRFWTEDSWCFDGQGYVDDDLYKIDGEETEDVDTDDLADNAVVEILEGSVCSYDKEIEDKDLVSVARAWVRKQATRAIVVEVPTEQVERFKSSLSNFGAKVLG